mmetsp:Transcript_38591/g.96322  ORF Transcript_38591/g.96322 Transcript_38591/m.96322 type:complete len:138 (+) Transcript_38591:35-448(+)
MLSGMPVTPAFHKGTSMAKRTREEQEEEEEEDEAGTRGQRHRQRQQLRDSPSASESDLTGAENEEEEDDDAEDDDEAEDDSLYFRMIEWAATGDGKRSRAVLNTSDSKLDGLASCERHRYVARLRREVPSCSQPRPR